MALAPSLLKELKQTVGLGAVVLAGLAATSETGIRGPSVGAVSVIGNAPEISVQLGPTSDPEIGELFMVGQIPFLQRILTIAPGLPDVAAEFNDLTPTLVWQETAQPTKATLTMAGLAPAVVGDTGQSIAITSGLVTLAGLVPTVSVPSGQEGAVAPDKAEMAISGFEPTIFLEIAVSPEQASLVFGGLSVGSSLITGWTTVPPETTPTWLDIPNV